MGRKVVFALEARLLGKLRMDAQWYAEVGDLAASLKIPRSWRFALANLYSREESERIVKNMGASVDSANGLQAACAFNAGTVCHYLTELIFWPVPLDKDAVASLLVDFGAPPMSEDQ